MRLDKIKNADLADWPTQLTFGSSRKSIGDALTVFVMQADFVLFLFSLISTSASIIFFASGAYQTPGKPYKSASVAIWHRSFWKSRNMAHDELCVSVLLCREFSESFIRGIHPRRA